MSAFLVEKRTIDKILSQIDVKIRQSYWLKEKFEKDLGINFAEIDWEDKLGQEMWDLNQLSLKYRYGQRKKNWSINLRPLFLVRPRRLKLSNAGCTNVLKVIYLSDLSSVSFLTA